MEHLYVYFIFIVMQTWSCKVPPFHLWKIATKYSFLLTSQPATLHPISVGGKSDFIFLVLLNELICIPCLR